MPENKVVSLEERSKDEQKPFLEELLRQGANTPPPPANSDQRIVLASALFFMGSRCTRHYFCELLKGLFGVRSTLTKFGWKVPMISDRLRFDIY